MFTFSPSLAYVRQFLISLQKLKHCILRVLCKINFFWKSFLWFTRDFTENVWLINGFALQLLWIFGNRDICLKTTCIESKISYHWTLARQVFSSFKLKLYLSLFVRYLKLYANEADCKQWRQKRFANRSSRSSTSFTIISF